MTPALSQLHRKLQNFFALPRFARLWVLPVWLLLGVSKALIRLVSFRRLAPWLGVASGVVPWIPLATPAQEARAERIGHVIRVAARHTPWDSNCFPQAVVARLLLGLYRVPYMLCFGLQRDRDTGGLRAHAWVAAGRVDVTGGTSFDQFTVVGMFVHRRLAGK